MDWKYWSGVALALIFFVFLIILGTNVSANRFASIVDREIPPPFLVTPLNGDELEFYILGEQKSLSVAAWRDFKSSIQNTLVTVKFNLAPRAEFLLMQWQKGLSQFNNDVDEIMNYFH